MIQESTPSPAQGSSPASESEPELGFDPAVTQVLLDWAAQMCLREVDEDMWSRINAPASKGELVEIQPDLQPWFDLAPKLAIEQGQEAYAAAFLLPKSPGLRLAGFTQGDTERQGPALADEMARLLVALNKGPDTQRFGKLPADHVAIALSALAALMATEPKPKVLGLKDALFMQALQQWAQTLSAHGMAHPLYQAVGKVCKEMLDNVLGYFDASADDKAEGAKPLLSLPVLQ